MKILVADDDNFYQFLLEKVLERWGYEVVSVSDGESALHVLREKNPPRLAILNWIMPGIDGIEVCRQIRKLGVEPYIYILLLTAKGAREDMVAGLGAEADDYLTKPFDFEELRQRLQSGMRILNVQTRLVSKAEEMHHQATHDGLTHLWNRAGILDVLNNEVARADRVRGPLSVAISDIDHFKRVNDTHGHAAGDAVLAGVAGKMLAAVRSYDAIGRYGGEEFLLIMPGSDAQAALSQAERIRKRIEKNPFYLSDKRIFITISLGVATENASTDGSADLLIQAADEALYRAKASGRNRVELAVAPDPGKESTSLAGAGALLQPGHRQPQVHKRIIG